MHPAHSRPIGPRTIPRSQSPLLPEIRPLQIRKASVDQASLRPPSPASLPQLSSSPTPSRPPIPGTSPTPRVNGSRPKLHLPISSSVSGATSYYSGPASIPPGLDGENPGGATVRPSDNQLQTPRPPEPNGVTDNSIEQLVAVFDKASVDSYTPTEETSTYGNDKWSDSVLEELSRLGEGQGGAVHKVRDIRNGRILARKTITTREAPLKQLERELSISSNAKHINIIQFYGAYMSPSSSEVKVMMEYGAGGSLEAVSKRIKERGARISEKVTGRIAEGVLQGLAYLHTLKTIHRDIKPSNILLTGEGVVRLCDFGVSGELVKSLAGTFTGTSFYMAPERISGKEYSIRADVWSTGITLLELVQNRYPFPDALTVIELLVHITKGEPPQLTDEPDVHWSDEMKDFIRQTLIVDGQTRPAPKDILVHPWIVNIMKKEVPMAKWISEVWGWQRRKYGSGDATSISRPSSSRGPRVPTPP
ncbi:kinase-like domain-containing protein [Phlebopus sp. FC_14]|nr:kinase-like domain-containing protein [Phlebopus sp. FC_14]